MNKKVLVALGGNAILKHGEKGTAEEQLEHVEKTAKHMIELVKENYSICITHGNGPQVGDILLKNEIAKDTLPPMPLDICGAESQGMIGYMLQQSMVNELKLAGIKPNVLTILTQTLVSKDDEAFKKPSKPIGPFYTPMQASDLRKERGWVLVNDSGRGYRRVVPSPKPIGIIEEKGIRDLFDSGHIVIAAGGGGIPVINLDKNQIKGIEAVIDKDHTAALLAKIIKAEILLILTDVEKISINFGKPNKQDLDHLNITQAKKYLNEGHFPPGNMGPKVESAIQFLEWGGEKSIITSLDLGVKAVKEEAGTTITP